MAKEKLNNETEKVVAHIKSLSADIAEVVEALRQIILQCDPQIGERIKWNNPSFFYNGPMQAFDPKEYKREIAVFNLFKGRIMLVFTSGAKIHDDSGLLEGDYSDGRRTAVFADIADVHSKQHTLEQIIRKWLALVEK